MTRSLHARVRRGAALLEAIVALTILAIAGIALLRSAAESYHVIQLSAVTERRMLDASRLMDAASLWSRAEMDQRLGERTQGDMRMRITRPLPELYQVELSDADDGRLLLATSLRRERTADAAR